MFDPHAPRPREYTALSAATGIPDNLATSGMDNESDFGMLCFLKNASRFVTILMF
jgi:hypothetical protein